MKITTKQITAIAMLSAISYVFLAVGRVPVVLFLKYDPKDVVVTLGGLIWGPMTSVLVSVIVSFIEMVTISDTGIIGCIMNIVSTCAFACTAAVIYKKKHTLKGALLALMSGCLVMVAVMMLWNYLITPIYMGYPREQVAAMLLPAFLPFNLIKGGLNAAFTYLLYKPVIGALRRTGFVAPSSASPSAAAKKASVGWILLAFAVIVTCVLLILVLNGTI